LFIDLLKNDFFSNNKGYLKSNDAVILAIYYGTHRWAGDRIFLV